MILLAVSVLLVAQSAGGNGGTLQPASAVAIIAGGKACLGTTIDPAGQNARLTGWAEATGAQKAGMKTDGRVVTRDNVMLVERPGIDGGCVVQAKAAAGFDKGAFLAALSTVAGVAINTDPKQPVTNLPNGEIMIVQIGDEGGASFVQLVVANPKGKHARNSKGN